MRAAELLHLLVKPVSHYRLVMVSDIAMPDGDGYDLMRNVRALEPAELAAAVAILAGRAGGWLGE